MRSLINIFIVLVFVFKTSHGQIQNLEMEIKNLKTPEELNHYWEQIKSLDQSKRGLKSSDSLDNINYKKVILLIKHHGYPKGSYIPNLVVTHQRSQYVNEYYFPIFYEAYKAGEADTSWFFHNVGGIQLGRFDRVFVDRRTMGPKDLDTIMKQMSPFLNTKVDFSLDQFDSLFNKYNADLNKIVSGEVLYRWKSESGDLYFFYRSQDKLFYHKLWRDGSCALPQEIKFNPVKDRYEYVKVIHNDFIKIDRNKTLEIYLEGVKREEVKIDE